MARQIFALALAEHEQKEVRDYRWVPAACWPSRKPQAVLLGGHAFRATVSSRDSSLVGHTLNEAEMFHLVKLTWNDMQSDVYSTQ